MVLNPRRPIAWRTSGCDARSPIVGVVTIVIWLLLSFALPARADSRLSEFLKSVQPTEIVPGADSFGPISGTPSAAPAFAGDRLLGYVYLNSDAVDSTGYSGKPINIIVGISLDGKITGAKLVEHHEPIFLVGIPQAKIDNFIHGYVGLNYRDIPLAIRGAPKVDIVSGATVTSTVIGDSITRSASQIARSRGLGGAQPELAAVPPVVKTVDQSKAGTEDWQTLVNDGSVRRLFLSIGDVNKAFEQSGNKEAIAHPEEGPQDEKFIDLYVALASVPSIGISLLGEAAYDQIRESLTPGQQAIIIAANGRYSFKGFGYVRGGIFDRIEIDQDDNTIRFRDKNQTRIGDLAAAGAPSFKEIGLFTVPAGAQFDPTSPWRLRLLVQRAMGARDKAFLTFDVSYALPSKYVKTEQRAVVASVPSGSVGGPIPGAAQEEPLWLRIWRGKIVEISVVVIALVILTLIFFFQDFLVRRPVLYDRVRLAYLVFTLVWLGWYAQAQLSVVNVLTFTSALRTDFKWDYFLTDPLSFILWFAVAASLLFWNRGAFCGWLCPFGALQELLNRGARLFRVPQASVPFGVHQRLWVIKYMIFLVLFGLSLYSLSLSEIAAEVEPFKTAIVLRFLRTWPFVTFAAVLLAAGLFIERFFCRYLCPLGAALAIPARLRMFDWLRRYRECGNPCQRCANECPVQSIHPEGHINPNECIQCLHCQMLYHHDQKCPVMIQRRLKRERLMATMSDTMHPAGARSGSPIASIPRQE